MSFEMEGESTWDIHGPDAFAGSNIENLPRIADGGPE